MVRDSISAGGHARVALESTAKYFKIEVPSRGSMPEDKRLVEIFCSIPWARLGGENFLWLFREPRNLRAKHSRYAQLCEHYGIKGRVRKEEVLIDPSYDRDHLDRIIERNRLRIQARQAASQQSFQPTFQQQLIQDTASQLAAQQINRTYSFNWQPVTTSATSGTPGPETIPDSFWEPNRGQ